jgi:hypothetical protein
MDARVWALTALMLEDGPPASSRDARAGLRAATPPADAPAAPPRRERSARHDRW